MNRHQRGTAATGIYRLKPRFLSVNGLIFYRALSEAVAGRATISCNVKLSQVISPQKTLSAIEQQQAADNINSLHVDFLLCSPNDFSVLAAVQTVDPGKPSLSEMANRQNLDTACKSANLPLFRFEYQHEYDLNNLFSELKAILPDSAARTQNTHLAGVSEQQSSDSFIELPHDSTQPIKAIPKPIQKPKPERVAAKPCPKCAKPLAIRVSKSGKNQGARYLVCSDYPVCNFITQLKTASPSNK